MRRWCVTETPGVLVWIARVGARSRGRAHCDPERDRVHHAHVRHRHRPPPRPCRRPAARGLSGWRVCRQAVRRGESADFAPNRPLNAMPQTAPCSAICAPRDHPDASRASGGALSSVAAARASVLRAGSTSSLTAAALEAGRALGGWRREQGGREMPKGTSRWLSCWRVRRRFEPSAQDRSRRSGG